MTKKLYKISIVIGFKVTWLSCILGEIYFNSWIGFCVGLVFLIFFFYHKIDQINLLQKILLLSSIGYFFDSCLSYFNLYTIKAQTHFLFLPIWFLILWPCLSFLLIVCFKFLKKQIFLPIFLGGILGPCSYYAGISSGLASVPNNKVFILISLFWIFIMLFFSNFLLRKKLF